MSAATDDSDLDALIGGVFARVGESPATIAARAELERKVAESRALGGGRKWVDPSTLRLRYSRLAKMALSPRHYRWAAQSDILDTVAIRIGHAFHERVLRGREIRAYDGRRVGARWDAFRRRAEDDGAIAVSMAESEREIEMARSVVEHPIAMELIHGDGAILETTIEWDHLGRACRSTPDSIGAIRQVELKSTRCAEPQWFAREALRRYYHGQIDFYDEAARVRDARQPGEAYIVAVENVPPYNVTIVRLTDEVREAARALWSRWFELVTVCEASGMWGHYQAAPVDLVLPEPRGDWQVEVEGELVDLA